MYRFMLSEAEWDWLVRLQFTPRRLAATLEEVGSLVVANLLRLKLVEEVEGYHHLTERGTRLIETPPRPLPDGSRIVKLQWVKPPADSA
ncbi:hypothetical protein [Planctomyces sp. SH-PL14]|uniref:hypothetical protein n=1 Tax=Planctomyces sp. SH-PL14 TaxID=1632864 RepID=UPI00078BFCD3|nr:hypothetical protein [Planctomyces sp. SH-PL14]AMV21751.1 hypothetical protein VT03_27870 [Planctomyces sp. SH-PL14]